MKIRRIDFSPDEWLAGTVALDDVDRGVYITACALIYSHGGPISIAELRRLCRSRKPVFDRALAHLIDTGKLSRQGDQLDNDRCERELANARRRSERGSENGILGGRPAAENSTKTTRRRHENDTKIPENSTKIPEDDTNDTPVSHDINDIPKPIGFRAEKLARAFHQPSTIRRKILDPAAAVPQPPARAREAPTPAARFRGRIINLTAADFATWQRAYHSIPDLAAELQTIDDKLVEQGHTGPWFGKVSGWLRRRHETTITQPNGSAVAAKFSDAWWHEMLSTILTLGTLTEDRWRRFADLGEPPGPNCRAPPHIAQQLGVDTNNPLPREEA